MNRIASKLATAALIGVLTWVLLGGILFEPRLVAAVFAVTIAIWTNTAVPAWMPAVGAPMLLLAAGVLSAHQLFISFTDSIVVLMIASFSLAAAIERSGLAQRVTLTLLSDPFSTKSFPRFLLIFGSICSILSLLLSNTAVAAMMLPLGIGIIRYLGRGLHLHARTAILLMITWGSSVAVGFLIGTPPNLIGASYAERLGVPIGFGTWLTFAMPINIIMIFVAWLILVARYGRDVIKMNTIHAVARRHFRALPPIKRSEHCIAIITGIAVLLWSVPDLLAAISSAPSRDLSFLMQLCAPSHVALALVAALLLLPKRVSSFGLSDLRQINWDTVLLFGGGIALGNAAVASGLTSELSGRLLMATGFTSILELTALCTFLAIFISELASNTASASIMVPIAASLAAAAGVPPIPPVLGAALGASFGFAMPISTPPNAIVYSSRLVPLREMFISGIILDLCGGIVIVLVLRYVMPMLGWW